MTDLSGECAFGDGCVFQEVDPRVCRLPSVHSLLDSCKRHMLPLNLVNDVSIVNCHEDICCIINHRRTVCVKVFAGFPNAAMMDIIMVEKGYKKKGSTPPLAYAVHANNIVLIGHTTPSTRDFWENFLCEIKSGPVKL